MRDFNGFPREEPSSAGLSNRPTAIHGVSEQRRLVEDSRASVMKGAPSEQRESDFWSSAPRYSRTSGYPEIALSLPPRPTPSLLRRVLTKMLFVLLFSAVLVLLAYEASVVFGFSWAALYRGE
jgi:hypothetical protein